VPAAARQPANAAPVNNAPGIQAQELCRSMLWVERLTLSNFRNYTRAVLEAGPEPQVLIGANGAGKTNLLEAVSLLGPGQGLRRAAYPELARVQGDDGWAVAARAHTYGTDRYRHGPSRGRRA
jgi:recombinational DNA repair ATPase RecF